LLFCQNNWRKDQGMKKKLIGLVGFVATWNLLVGHLFIYLAGLIFLSKFYNFIY